jgi:hypothetical protein
VTAILPQIFDERIWRLALGLEPRDAVSRLRIARPVDVAVDGAPTFDVDTAPWPEQSAVTGLRRLTRHGSGRFALVFDPTVRTPLTVRLVPSDRRYIPRRLELAIVSEADVLAAESAGDDVPTTSRVWRPVLFPGAGYDVAETATGVRGSVTHAGKPVRWTRVEAAAQGQVIGRAHGDDRGEFLLVLGQNTGAGAVSDLTSPLPVTITVFARDPALPLQMQDALADLPVETAAAPGVTPDDVAAGVALPASYVQIAQLVDHPLTLGRLSSVPIAV